MMHDVLKQIFLKAVLQGSSNNGFRAKMVLRTVAGRCMEGSKFQTARSKMLKFGLKSPHEGTLGDPLGPQTIFFKTVV